jgi:hypothetical protein
MSKPHGQKPLRSSNGGLLTPSHQRSNPLVGKLGVWSQMQSFENMHGKDLMKAYHFVEVGTISAPDPTTFKIELTLKNAAKWEKAVYLFLFNEEIVRIGSSKGRLETRMKQWSKDVTNALLRINGLPFKHTNTPDWEAREWLQVVEIHKSGMVYAREAHLVTTPIGSFRAYMDEESILINRHKPKLNRHTNR